MLDDFVKIGCQFQWRVKFPARARLVGAISWVEVVGCSTECVAGNNESGMASTTPVCSDVV